MKIAIFRGEKREKIEAENFCLPSHYQVGKALNQFDHPPALRRRYGSIYAAASYLASEANCKYIIDVGCGYAEEKADYIPISHYIGIGDGSRLSAMSTLYPNAKLLCTTLTKFFSLDPELLKTSVVVCDNILGEMQDPEPLLASLSKMAQTAPFVLISAIDRQRSQGSLNCGPPALPGMVRDWTGQEFAQLLKKYSLCSDFIGNTIYHGAHTEKLSLLSISGTHATFKSVPRKKVLAIVSCFNDRDVIRCVAEHLLNEGVHIWFIDNWSEDGTWEIINALKTKFPGQIAQCERFPSEQPDAIYDWNGILRRKEVIAFEQRDQYDWFIHHDSDEIRTSPWPGVKMADAISYIGSLGYDVINHLMLDFRPTEDGFTENHHLQQFFSHFEFNVHPSAYMQTKGWASRSEKINLTSTGGHDALFVGRKVFPLRFLLAHYSLRSINQASRKIFKHRLPRFGEAERKLGWHMHYDHYQSKATEQFLWNPDQLIAYSPAWFASEFILERLLGLNLRAPSVRRSFEPLSPASAATSKKNYEQKSQFEGQASD